MRKSVMASDDIVEAMKQAALSAAQAHAQSLRRQGMVRGAKAVKLIATIARLAV